MKRLLLVILLLTSSCVHATINRVDRHRRFIKVETRFASSKVRSFRHLKHKAENLGCNKLDVLKIEEGYASGICWN